MVVTWSEPIRLNGTVILFSVGACVQPNASGVFESICTFDNATVSHLYEQLLTVGGGDMFISLFVNFIGNMCYLIVSQL